MLVPRLSSFEVSNGPVLQLSCPLLYTRCARFLHSHVICCKVCLLSPQILHNGFPNVLSILCFVDFVLDACSCAAHIVASVYTLRLLCTKHFHDKSLFFIRFIPSSISQTNCPCILFSSTIIF